ncbi:MAG: dihydrodipicolinate synthase family protein [Anaerolineae bacterium]|nr:dihydrodipicolinate synthase family protein [Anaerolineae bacterium]
MSTTYRGVYTIPSTPFHDSLEVDWDGLRRVVEFCVECGAHGIVWPVNASGFAVLSDEERLKGAPIVVDQVAGRIPVVIGTQGVCASHAAMFSRHANEIGADAVIAMAPYIQKLEDEESVVAYYRAISEVVDIPIFIQNHARGSSLSVKTMARIVREVEHVEYIKEETAPVTHKLTEVLGEGGPKLKGVFGGAGGRYLLLEHPRGVAGQMPGCHVTDVIVRLWNALDDGDLAEAKRIYGLVAPLFALEAVGGTSYAEVLRRRGVIDTSHSRYGTAGAMDEHDHRALDDILRDLEPLLVWHGGGPLRYSEALTEGA